VYFRAIAVFAILVAASPALANTCAENMIELRSGGVQAQFEIELAVTPAEQAEGLMFRENMPQFSGMLFIYEREQRVSFWMKNTLIPLDMLFIDSTGTVQRIKENATPEDTTPIPGGDNIQYVLEINGGMSQMLGLSDEVEVRYIGFDQEKAVWPCE